MVKKSNGTVTEASTTRSLIRRLRKYGATLLGHVMRRETLEYLVTNGMIEGKRSMGIQREKILHGIHKLSMYRTSDRCNKDDEGSWKVKMAPD